MRKVKNLIVVLVTAALVLTAGFVPMAAAQFQDQATTGVVKYESIEALQLKLEEEAPDMTFVEKMFLLTNGVGMEVTDENTRIKEEEILETAYAAVAPYLELYFGDSVDNDFLHYNAAMVYDERDPTRYCYYWFVQLSLDISYNDTISIVLDDETGKILAIEVTDPDFGIAADYFEKLQYAISTIYLSELGMSPAEEWPMEIESVAKDWNVAIPAVGAHYLFVEPLYGEISVEICVHSDGFYICIA